MRLCSVEICFGVIKCKGLCSKHYWAQPERRAASRENLKKHYKKHKAKINAKNSAWGKANRDKRAAAAKRLRHSKLEEARAAALAWQKTPAGRAYTRSATAKRRSKKLKATPKWAELEQIKVFYGNCPPGHHVDHIYPLNSPDVCGLHVLSNLQYLPAAENLKKSNKF